MKTSANLIRVKSLFLLLFFTMFQLVIFAQDEQGSSTTTTHSSTKTSLEAPGTADSAAWYTSPWVWIVGAAVFILLLVAILSNRGTNRSDTVVVKKTVERDIDPDL